MVLPAAPVPRQPADRPAEHRGDDAAPERRRDRVMALAALTSFAVTIAVLFVPHASLPEDATAREVSAFFTDHYTVQQSQTVMHSLGAVALLVFLARLATLVAALERQDEGWSRLVLAASASIAAVVVVTMGFVSAAVYLTGSIDGDLQEALYMMGWDFHFKIAYLIPLVLVPACYVLRRERAVSGVVSWSGLVLGALALVSTLGNLTQATMPAQYPVFILFLLWTLMAGLVIGVRGTRGLPVR